MPTDLPVTSATVPSPLDCIISSANWQSLVELLSVSFPNDLGNFSKGNTEPAPDRRSDPWFRYNADGSPDKWYVYAMGAWISMHPSPSGLVCMYEGSEASIDTFDGGEAGAVTSISGPMWEKVTSMNARFPIGPGALPSTSIIAIGDTGGEEEHALTIAEMPPHTHFVRAVPRDTDGGTQVQRLGNMTGSEVTPVANQTVTESEGGSGSPAAVEGHNTLPPYTAIWFIRRTARLFYRL